MMMATILNSTNIDSHKLWWQTVNIYLIEVPSDSGVMCLIDSIAIDRDEVVQPGKRCTPTSTREDKQVI